MSEQHQIDVTLTHYRCFQETTPITFSLQPGKTIALVGMNNVGKSALIRFFYELKNVLTNCSSGSWSDAGVIAGIATEITSGPADPCISTRYGLSDFLDLYPDRRASSPIKFAFDCNKVSCSFEISKNSAQDSYGLIKTIKSDTSITNIAIDAIAQFQNTLYFGAHRNLVNEGAGGGAYFDLSVGTAFTSE